MSEAAERLYELAMKLPENERKELVHRLLAQDAANDDMAPEERAELLKAIAEAEQDIDAGRVVGEAEVWASLKAIK